MSCIAVIPARGGSKGVPGKNLKPLANRPLIAWTIEEALKVAGVDEVIVSTDDDEIAEVSRGYGASVPFVRPADLAQDSVHAVHVVLHLIEWLSEYRSTAPDAITMLLPTAPLRRRWHVEKALGLFAQQPESPVISVYRSLTPLISLRWIEEGRMKPVVETGNLNVQRQDLKPVYGVNGSIYIASVEHLKRTGSFHTEDARPFVMDRLHSLDINSLDDFAMAEHFLTSPDFDLDKSLLEEERAV
ncbi:cytidylyltransferase domain-containing protein [Roseibium limicola]|uniref:Acylneuraminate cytidylyltransferase family protein n=1 Tax=Roseibium limicola TaxID=2816037 RepID=A0A939EP35_9HYPH|nr:acylneuraminate cytidylyltransferase family protein [Roseibium limicola]MBO0346094.1 acylneuraminate cytidylyltransferase family protein [Roseibium limicola]